MSKQEYNYNYLLTKFEEKVIKERYNYMEQRATAFIKKSNLEKDVYLNHN